MKHAYNHTCEEFGCYECIWNDNVSLLMYHTVCALPLSLFANQNKSDTGPRCFCVEKFVVLYYWVAVAQSVVL